MPSPEPHCVVMPVFVSNEPHAAKTFRGGLEVEGVLCWDCGCTWVWWWFDRPHTRIGHQTKAQALECAWQARAQFGLSELDPVTWA